MFLFSKHVDLKLSEMNVSEQTKWIAQGRVTNTLQCLLDCQLSMTSLGLVRVGTLLSTTHSHVRLSSATMIGYVSLVFIRSVPKLIAALPLGNTCSPNCSLNHVGLLTLSRQLMEVSVHSVSPAVETTDLSVKVFKYFGGLTDIFVH